MLASNGIKRRLKSVDSVGKITKAMELVAATKMRKAQAVALGSRPYVFTALELLANLERRLGGAAKLNQLLQKRPVVRTCYVLVVSDKGLTGSFNTNVFRAFEKHLAPRAPSGEITHIAVGEKARQFLARRGADIAGTFSKFGDYTSLEEVAPLSTLLIKGYEEGMWDEVHILYTTFKSAMSQEVVERVILPVDFNEIKRVAKEIIPESGRFAELLGDQSFFNEKKHAFGEFEYLIEPSPQEVLAALVPFLVEMQVYHVILEANAAEHSARRLAMKNASDNADELKDDLTIEYNKSRQSGITREITEITAGAEAIQS